MFLSIYKGCNASKGQEMDSNQSGAVGGAIWGPKSPKNELNVQFFKKCPLSGCDIKNGF